MRTITLQLLVEVPDLADDATVAFTVAEGLRTVADACDRRGVLPSAPSTIGDPYSGTRRGTVEHVTDTLTVVEDTLTLDLGEPVDVHADGTVTEATDPDSTYLAGADPVDVLGDDLDGTCRGFSNVSARFTNQQGAPDTLDGAEYVGESMRQAILSTPGTYLAVASGRDEEDLAWIVLHRPVVEDTVGTEQVSA